MVYGRYNYSIHGVYKPTFTSLGGTILYNGCLIDLRTRYPTVPRRSTAFHCVPLYRVVAAFMVLRSKMWTFCLQNSAFLQLSTAGQEREEMSVWVRNVYPEKKSVSKWCIKWRTKLRFPAGHVQLEHPRSIWWFDLSFSIGAGNAPSHTFIDIVSRGDVFASSNPGISKVAHSGASWIAFSWFISSIARTS